MSAPAGGFQTPIKRLRMSSDSLYGQFPGFYDLVAGGLFGGGIEGAARALEELGTKGPYNLVARLAGVITLFIAGGLLIRITRVLEDIDRAYQASSYVVVAAQVKEGKTDKEIEDELKKFRRDLRSLKDKPSVVISSFRLAFFFIILSLIFFLAAGLLEPHINYIASLWQWCAQTFQALLQILKY